jgi:deazaflavin-dependent oxidoreductase (nitroreductase family)
MPLPRGLARANRYFINPVARRVAGWAPGFCILTHIGRRSGREYRLPLNVFRSGDTFVFALTYGSNTDWVRNVMAAGRCSIRYRRRDYELSNLRFLDEEEGMGHMPTPVRLFLPRIHVTEFLAGDVETQPT